MIRKKITIILVGVSIAMITFFIISYKVMTKFHNINQNKGEDIIEKHQEWMHQVITLSDTIPIKIKQQRDSIIKSELMLLRRSDSVITK